MYLTADLDRKLFGSLEQLFLASARAAPTSRVVFISRQHISYGLVACNITDSNTEQN